MKTINIDGVEIELTTERQLRIIDAIAETQRLIDREMRYRADLRKTENIHQWQRHIMNLQAMLG